jgi:hypothetical protein
MHHPTLFDVGDECRHTDGTTHATMTVMIGGFAVLLAGFVAGQFL